MIVVAFLGLLGVVALVARATHQAESVGARPPRSVPSRPWWGDPRVWVIAAIASVVVGVLLAPGLFGRVVVFLPFLWLGRARTGGHHGRRRGREEPDR